MRPLWKDVLVAVWLGIILPGIVLNAFVLKERHRRIQQADAVTAKTVVDNGQFVPVKKQDGTFQCMNLDTYLTGVLLAEMPAQFHPEALKAQSVAARTYTWKAYTTGGKHGDGSVCTDSACCQAYIAEEAYLSLGGTPENLEKVRNSVNATAGIVIAYGGELIEATYFSSSGGSTEAAEAVWGADYPYLQSVTSPEQSSADTVSYTPAEFQHLLGRNLSGTPETWFGAVAYTEGGGVQTIEICNEIYTGVQLRSLLGLRSTAFHIETDAQTIAITTQGYGHRVGMSQYGANEMAESGSNWQQILQHYYPGTTLFPIMNQ